MRHNRNKSSRNHWNEVNSKSKQITKALLFYLQFRNILVTCLKAGKKISLNSKKEKVYIKIFISKIREILQDVLAQSSSKILYPLFLGDFSERMKQSQESQLAGGKPVGYYLLARIVGKKG